MAAKLDICRHFSCIQIFTCINIRIILTIGAAVRQAMHIVKNFGIHKCGHEKKPISGANCLMSMTKNNMNTRWLKKFLNTNSSRIKKIEGNFVSINCYTYLVLFYINIQNTWVIKINVTNSVVFLNLNQTKLYNRCVVNLSCLFFSFALLLFFLLISIWYVFLICRYCLYI